MFSDHAIEPLSSSVHLNCLIQIQNARMSREYSRRHDGLNICFALKHEKQNVRADVRI